MQEVFLRMLNTGDHVLFLMLYNTGARVSEIIGVKVGEVVVEDRAAFGSGTRAQ
jgi:site-specific recombinase XerD